MKIIRSYIANNLYKLYSLLGMKLEEYIDIQIKEAVVIGKVMMKKKNVHYARWTLSDSDFPAREYRVTVDFIEMDSNNG